MKINQVKMSVGLAVAGGVAAVTLAAPMIANAATPSPSPTPTMSGSGRSAPPGAGGKGGGETALTGTTAQRVTEAALAAVPGATVRRVTTEHAGASNPYEAHLTKSDGSRVTALVSSSFTVLSVQADPGHGGKGGGETALTGTTAQRVTEAALAAVPGATVRRVTTEHAGASNPYEAHLTKSDGSRVTALVSSSFTVLSVQADPGHR